MQKIQIGNKIIGDKVYTIAEFGVNHLNNLGRAKEGIKAAAKAGADAIKFQTYTADELVVKGTPKFWNWEGDKHHETQYDAYKALGNFPRESYKELIDCCNENGIEFLSTPFSIEAADFLNSLGMKAFKIASSDMSTLPFLSHIAKFGKPILLSTGASTIIEIEEAVETIRDVGNDQIVLLHCTLCYPTENKNANLNLIKTLQDKFRDLPIGISDHTLGVFPSVIAAAMGATVIEKHFTLDKTLPESADHWLSVDPGELGILVDHVRLVEELRGSKTKKVFDCEKETRLYDKRSIVSAVDIAEGSIINEDMLTYKRPGTGIQPRFNKVVVGKKASRLIPADTVLTWEML